MIHFHGTPITPQARLMELAGRHFCVRYGRHEQVALAHEIGQSVMLDNGAFSFWQQGHETDWLAYYRFCSRWLEHWSTWAVIPDVIDGTEDDNDRLLREWPFGTRGAPVWHLHESLSRLVRLCEQWPLVCLGSSGEYREVDSPSWRERMAGVMDVATDRDGVPWTRLHMLRGMRFVGGPYPFYSADSTNLARNHAGNHTRGTPRKDIVQMAHRIDALQTPARWVRTAEQMELTA